MAKVILVFAFTLFALVVPSSTDVTGQWKGSVSDQFEVTVFFEMKDDKLTAKVRSQIGETIFTDGKVTRDSLSFTNQSFNGITIESLKGKVDGETLNFVVNFQGQDIKGVLRKVTE